MEGCILNRGIFPVPSSGKIQFVDSSGLARDGDKIVCCSLYVLMYPICHYNVLYGIEILFVDSVLSLLEDLR